MIDSHTHLYEEQFDIDRQEIIDNMQLDGLQAILSIGTDHNTSSKSIELAQKNKNIYATVGLHPHYCVGSLDMGWIQEFAKSPKVVAIGEFGLDYHYQDADKILQRQAMEFQLNLSTKLKLPNIIHLRDAKDDCLDIFKDYQLQYGGVMHCFSGDVQLARTILDKGYYISFSGNVTYKNAQQIKDAAKFVPLQRLMIETDCPYLSPVPFRGGRNQPKYVLKVAEYIAELKNIPLQDILQATTTNTKTLFNI
jgi:TatD DNase family protein